MVDDSAALSHCHLAKAGSLRTTLFWAMIKELLLQVQIFVRSNYVCDNDWSNIEWQGARQRSHLRLLLLCGFYILSGLGPYKW